MNADYQIYSAPDDVIPAEDKARLDGYLRGRHEAQIISTERIAAMEAKAEMRDAGPAA